MKKELSQTKLAEKLFVSRSAVVKWENGLGLPSDYSLISLLKFRWNVKNSIETN